MNASMIDFDVFEPRITGLRVITMKQVTDERGTIRELFRRSAFEANDLPVLDRFEQINITESRRGAIRGMHAEAMTKLLAVAHGEAFGAYVDLRPASPTFGVVETIGLVPGRQVLVPSGVANGFQGVGASNQYVYCFDREWSPGMKGVACNPLDPHLAIPWPIAIDPDDRSMISAKDRSAPGFLELARELEVSS
jgi:dTDP-4-dehydrorhamnose 3,5-epimerase